ncbi:hypothetical protein Lal_00020565, partial [Lupinus albus]
MWIIKFYFLDRKNKADTEVSATSQSDRSISKGTNLGGAENENERKLESIPFSNKQPPTNSKKSGLKGEGANSTPSALTKLTSRLNFLKVRQSSDKGRDRDTISHNLEKGNGSETQYEATQEKGRGLDSSHSGKEKSHQSSEKLRKSDSQPGMVLEAIAISQFFLSKSTIAYVFNNVLNGFMKYS